MFASNPNAPLPPGTCQASSRGFAPSEATAPIYSALVAAGFPSPADDHLEGKLDLHELMVMRMRELERSSDAAVRKAVRESKRSDPNKMVGTGKVVPLRPE